MKIIFLIIGLMSIFGVANSTDPPSKKAEQFYQRHASMECEDPCPWDLDDDGIIVLDDVLLFFFMGYGLETDQGCQDGDYDEDGIVTVLDFRIGFPHLGELCP